MNEDIKTKWLKALRSGEYKQGHGALQGEEGGYCCLGVLCDIMDPDDNYVWRGCTYLPLLAMHEAGLDSANPEVFKKGYASTLAGLNDSEETSFDQIADLIEEQL